MRPMPRITAPGGALLIAGLLALGQAGGCTNDPFDPASLPNSPPQARIYIGPVVPGGDLNPTSYYKRTFRWSGSDEDGFVTEFHVSIESEEGVAAPWAVTQETDTTMTFSTDDEGEAYALIRLACRDDRGAMSDTIEQFIPLKNFPPVINFQSDFDTLTFSYGSASFRFFTLDLDGNETMDDTVTYYLDTADTTLAPVIEGEPGADPSQRPVRLSVADEQDRTFEIGLHGVVAPGTRTLTVRVSDEADAEARFQWTWESLPLLSPVLLVDDFGGDLDVPVYHASMDSVFGAGNWSLLDMPAGGDRLMDRQWVLTETLRQFDAVFWYTAYSASANLKKAIPSLTEYLDPTDGAAAGRLLLATKNVVGASSNLPPGFVQSRLGIRSLPAPATEFAIPADKTAFALAPNLPDLHPTNSFGRAVGIQAMAGADTLYQMEYSRYSTRPPYEPLVGMRWPGAATAPVASAVTLSLQLDYLNRAELAVMLRAILGDELGVSLP